MQPDIQSWAEELVACIHFLHQKGYAPATSSNYSFYPEGASTIYISSSGKDKGTFSIEDLMQVDLEGKAIEPDRKPSAETLLHTLIYRKVTDARCILHTHTTFNTSLSGLYEEEGKVLLEGFEVLKGLRDIKSHDVSIALPIFKNSQDMPALAAEIEKYWEKHPEMQGFLLSRHGLYTWGRTIAEAKRHIEVFEFLLECFYQMNIFKQLQLNKTSINGYSTHS